MTEPDFALLAARCTLLRDLSEADLRAVIEQGRFFRFSQGHVFFRQGEESTWLYVLTEGRAKLTQVTADGNQVIVNYFGPGEGLGIIVALRNQPYPLTAEAMEAGAAVGWEREVMRALMRQYPQLAMNGMELIGRRFTMLQERFQEAATLRVEQRIARALLRLVRQFGRRTEQGVLIDMPLTRQEVAEMTGTNLYNVSRILSRWEQEGLIDTSRRRITLLKSHELVLLAEDLPRPGAPPDASPDGV